MLLAVASAIFLWSESLGTRDHILLSFQNFHSFYLVGLDLLIIAFLITAALIFVGCRLEGTNTMGQGVSTCGLHVVRVTFYNNVSFYTVKNKLRNQFKAAD
jgi:hypothetical protein